MPKIKEFPSEIKFRCSESQKIAFMRLTGENSSAVLRWLVDYYIKTVDKKGVDDERITDDKEQ